MRNDTTILASLPCDHGYNYDINQETIVTEVTIIKLHIKVKTRLMVYTSDVQYNLLYFMEMSSLLIGWGACANLVYHMAEGDNLVDHPLVQNLTWFL